MRSFRFVCVIFILSLSSLANPQEPGEEVFVKIRAMYRIGTKDKGVELTPGVPRIIKQVSNGWIFLDGAPGWLSHRDIIPAKDALAYFSQLIVITPEDPWGYRARAGVHRINGNYEEALADYNRAAMLKTQDALLYVEKGGLLQSLGRYDEAIADFTTGMTLAPDATYFYQMRGHSFGMKGDFKGALADFNTALRLNQLDNGSSHMTLAWFRATCRNDAYRNGPEALDHAQKAIKLAERQNWAHFRTLAAAYAANAEFDAALKWQEKALAVAPAGQLATLQQQLTCYNAHEPFLDLPFAVHTSPPNSQRR